MAGDLFCASFQSEADAYRAATQLRAAGLADEDVVVSACREGDSGLRGEVGVPDDGASVEGLRIGDAEPARAFLLTIRSLEASRLSRDATLHLIEAAGGRVDAED